MCRRHRRRCRRHRRSRQRPRPRIWEAPPICDSVRRGRRERMFYFFGLRVGRTPTGILLITDCGVEGEGYENVFFERKKTPSHVS